LSDDSKISAIIKFSIKKIPRCMTYIVHPELPAGGGFATSNITDPESMSLSLNRVKSMPYTLASGGHK
jgi:hypothetical protein